MCWYVFMVALKVKKASLAQNRALPTIFFILKLPTKNKFESTPRVTHGPLRTRVTDGVEYAQKERAAALSAGCLSYTSMLSLQ